MKYIRTKNNIFEVLEETELVYRVKAKGNPNNVYSRSKKINDVLNQADTIEELCDEFVAVHYLMDEPVHIIEPRLTGHMSLKEQISLRNRSYTIYGAIWTDKGLIYVAKINDKGELELL